MKIYCDSPIVISDTSVERYCMNDLLTKTLKPSIGLGEWPVKV